MKELSQEEKELLLKDLSARLPYQPLCKKIDAEDNFCECDASLGYSLRDLIDNKIIIKPYLRPMSSMTEEEKREIYDWLVENDVDWFDFSKLRLDEILISFDSSWLLVNWLLEHHFDHRGLIEKGLAIEAPEGMYNN